MKINALSLNNQLASLQCQLEERKYVAVLGLAKQIAYRLALPTSPVESLGEYFNDNHRDAIESILYKLNESTVISVSETLELTFKIFKLRYRMVYDVMAVDVSNFIDYHLESDNDEMPAIYKTVYEKVGKDKIKSIIKSIGYSFEETGV